MPKPIFALFVGFTPLDTCGVREVNESSVPGMIITGRPGVGKNYGAVKNSKARIPFDKKSDVQPKK